MDELSMEEGFGGGVWTVIVHGDVDLSTAPDLCRRLTAHRGEALIVDLTDVGFCDSCGLRAILGEARETAIVGGSLTVVAPPGTAVRRLVELCGLTETLDVREHLRAA